MSAGSGYETGTPSGVCAHSGDALAVGSLFVASLFELEDGTLARSDYGLNAWSDGARPAPPERLIGFWRSVVPEPNAKRSPVVAAGELMELFEQLGEADDPKRLAFRYFVCLMLVRKRSLTLEDSVTHDGDEVLLVRPRGVPLPPDRGGEGPPLLEVVSPGLDEATLASAMAELDAVLTSEARAGLGA
ncbi:MAG: hypothetical protein AAGG07_01945 [Planctomycetota bacterium]